MPATTIDSAAVLRASQAHERRLGKFVGEHMDRRRRGIKHPVWDFLFTYYNLAPKALLRWHPGAGVVIRGAAAENYRGMRGYLTEDRSSVVDPSYIDRHRGLIEYAVRLLRATASRPPVFGCFGLHEWAMVYAPDGADHRRHDVPLRLGRSDTNSVVESHAVRCTHFDAYRFFVDRSVNRYELSRDNQMDFEQPGCVHAGMDLYKWSAKLLPMVDSDLVADAFELAVTARELDMRASPYKLDEYGFSAIPIETPAGRADYVRQQTALSQRAASIRLRLTNVCGELLRI